MHCDTHIRTYLYAHTEKRIHIRIYLYAHMSILICTYTNTYAHTRVYLFAYYAHFLVHVYLSSTVVYFHALGWRCHSLRFTSQQFATSNFAILNFHLQLVWLKNSLLGISLSRIFKKERDFFT